MFEIIAKYTKDGNIISKLGNIASICYEEIIDLNWCGFYFYNYDSKALVLGPFQGKKAVSVIALETGVCGQAFREEKILNIDDVHCCEEHIACDLSSKSELVIPLKKDGKVVGVLDIDSPLKNRFDEKTVQLLIRVAAIVEELI